MHPKTLFPLFLKLLFLYFVVGMHVILDTPGGSGLYLSFNTLGWIFTVILISLGLWQITLNQKIYYSKFQLLALIGFVLLCLPLFYDNEFSDHAIPRVLGLAGGLLFWLVLNQFYFASFTAHQGRTNSFSLTDFKNIVSKKVSNTILLWIVYAVAIEALFGLIQVFILSPGDWSGYTPGKSRPHGVFLQPNVMASFMATGLAIALYLSVNLRYLTLKRFNRTIIYFTLLSASFLLVLLQSRSGHLSSFIVLILLGIYVYRASKKQAKSNLAATLVGICSAMLLLSFSQGDVYQRGADNYQTPGARPHTYIVTSELILQNPLKGVGYGLYERGFLDTYNEMVKKRPELLPVQHRMAHPHNEVLLWVSEGGLAALLGLLCFALGYILVWRKIPHTKAWAILGLITPLLLHSQLEFPFYLSLSHWLVFIILIWVAELHSQTRLYIFNFKRTFFLRSMSVIIALIFIPFFVTTLHTANIMVKYQASRGENLLSLKEIVNPIGWKRQLEKYIYGNILYSGIKNKDKRALQFYIQWGLEHVKYKPSAIVYSNILLSYKLLGKMEKYKLLLVEARKTYPLYNQWGNHYKTQNSGYISNSK